jgi:hypothetical protein
VTPQAKEDDIRETMQLLCQRHSQPPPASMGPPPHVSAGHAFAAIEESLRSGGVCGACGMSVAKVFITPCAHLLCAGCLSQDSTACTATGCGHAYTMQSVDDPARCVLP